MGLVYIQTMLIVTVREVKEWHVNNPQCVIPLSQSPAQSAPSLRSST